MDRSGDKHNLTEAFLECQDELFSFLNSRLNCPETAKELRQETYVRIQGVQNEDHINDCRSYIFKVARNLLINHVRDVSRRNALLAEAGSLPWGENDPPSPERTAIARAELEALRLAIAELPALTRKIFIAHRFKAKTRREIAHEFGVSLTTVENHIRRALEHFAQALEK